MHVGCTELSIRRIFWAPLCTFAGFTCVLFFYLYRRPSDEICRVLDVHFVAERFQNRHVGNCRKKCRNVLLSCKITLMANLHFLARVLMTQLRFENKIAPYYLHDGDWKRTEGEKGKGYAGKFRVPAARKEHFKEYAGIPFLLHPETGRDRRRLLVSAIFVRNSRLSAVSQALG